MTEEKPEKPPSPVLIALAAVAGVCFAVYAAAPLVSALIGAYWPRERASELTTEEVLDDMFGGDAGGP